MHNEEDEGHKSVKQIKANRNPAQNTEKWKRMLGKIPELFSFLDRFILIRQTALIFWNMEFIKRIQLFGSPYLTTFEY